MISLHQIYQSMLRLICFTTFLLASTATFAATVCTTGFISLTGSYYTANNWTGGPTNRTDTSINYDWGGGNPGLGGLGNDNFSIIWNGSIRAMRTGVHSFRTASDDGVRVTVNGSVIINNLVDHALATDTSSGVTLVAGQSYTIKVEYVEKTVNAVIKLYWMQPGETEYSIISTPTLNGGDTASASAFCSCSTGVIGGLMGDFYNNTTLTAPIVQSRLETTVNYNWAGAPGPTSVNANSFSARWNGTFRAAVAGDYLFQVAVDDGVRLYVNNTLVIDKWFANDNVTYQSSAITLAANTDYPIKLEYYEGSVNAIIKLESRISSGSYAVTYGCPGTAVAYYGINHSGTGTTCAASPITITAYDAAGNITAPLAGTVATLSTASGAGTWVGGNTHTFNGTETAFTKSLQQSSAATLNINVSDGTYSEIASKDDTLTFAAAGLSFYANSAASTAISTQVAGTVDSSPIVKVSNCATRVSASSAPPVSFAVECRNPTSCIAGQSFTVNSVAARANNNATSIVYNSSAQSLSFNSAGVASIPIKYSDVGQVKIHASMTLPSSGDDPALTLTANSGDFVVKPHTLVATTVQSNSSTPSANPGGTSASGTGALFVPAGTAFSVKVEVRNAAGSAAPNFGNETPTENNLKFVEQSLTHPAGGTLTALSNASAFSATTPAGTFVNSTIYWNQVGSFTARPELADNDYLGAGDVPNKTITGNIGRFYPDHFGLVSASTTAGCGTFTYLGQPSIGLSYVLEAQSSGNAVVTNYGSSYGTLAVPSYVAENANSGDGLSYGGRLADGVTPAWSGGVMTVNSTAASVLRKLTTYAHEAPLNSLQWGLNLSESFDGGRSLSGKNMDPLSSGACVGAGCTAVALGSPLLLRYGRLRLDPAAGPETVALPVNFATEYWTGSQYVLNALDSCTLVPRSAITYTRLAPTAGAPVTVNTDANLEVALTGGLKTLGVYSAIDASNVRFTAGKVGHHFTAPGAGGVGSLVVGIDLTSLAWLRYDWDQNLTYNDSSIPNVPFTFGTYRGKDRIIYWAERLQ